MVPSFKIKKISIGGRGWKPGVLESLPAPISAFGLELSRTKITDAGLKELVKMKQFVFLELENTKVTKAGVAELQKALPKCIIRSNATK